MTGTPEQCEEETVHESVSITLVLKCRDDVPDHVIKWMGNNLAEHAEREFGSDYNPEWFPEYEEPPVCGRVTALVSGEWVACEEERWHSQNGN